MKCTQCKGQCPVPQVCEVAEDEEQSQKQNLLSAIVLVLASFGSAMLLAYLLP